MVQKRNQFTASFKAKVALEAFKGERSINEIAGCYGVHPTQVTQWKKQLLSSTSRMFERGRPKEQREKKELIDELYRQMGILKVELDGLKKNRTGLIEDPRKAIDPMHPQLSIQRQCELLELPRSTYY